MAAVKKTVVVAHPFRTKHQVSARIRDGMMTTLIMVQIWVSLESSTLIGLNVKSPAGKLERMHSNSSGQKLCGVSI